MLTFVQTQTQHQFGDAPLPPHFSNPRGGATRVYKPEFCQRARDYCFLGATNAQLARFFSVSEAAIESWLVKHEAFYNAVLEGRVTGDPAVVGSLYKRAVGYTIKTRTTRITRRKGIRGQPQVEEQITETETHVPGDVTAALKWLQFRCGWTEKKPGEFSLDELIAFATAARAEAARRGIDYTATVERVVEAVPDGRGAGEAGDAEASEPD